MARRSLLLITLAGLILLAGWSPTGRGQDVGSMPPPEGQTTLPGYPAPVAEGGSEPGAPVRCPLFETARPITPWYADAETAFLFTTAVHFNENVYRVEENNSYFVSPKVFLGYRFEGGHSLRFTYRNLTELGHLGKQDESGDYGSTDTTFTTNWFDLDLVSREYAPTDWWRLQVEAGGRFVYRYRGSEFEAPGYRNEISTTYFGGGPHLGVTSQCLLGRTGWSLYGRADTAVTFGGGELKVTTEAPGYWMPESRQRASEFQVDVDLQLGLMKRWQMERCGVGLGLGVQADLLTSGSLEGPANTFGFVNVGPFLRGEIDF